LRSIGEPWNRSSGGGGDEEEAEIPCWKRLYEWIEDVLVAGVAALVVVARVGGFGSALRERGDRAGPLGDGDAEGGHRRRHLLRV
jgi:hypothetical protein